METLACCADTSAVPPAPTAVPPQRGTEPSTQQQALGTVLC